VATIQGGELVVTRNVTGSGEDPWSAASTTEPASGPGLPVVP